MMTRRALSPVWTRVIQYAAIPFLPWIRKRIAEDLTDNHAARVPANILRCVRKREGLAGMLLADALLFGLCLMLGIALDAVPTLSQWARIGIGMAGCALAFDIWNDGGWRALLKLGFVALCATVEGYWTVTILFLIVFENITWEDCLE